MEAVSPEEVDETEECENCEELNALRFSVTANSTAVNQLAVTVMSLRSLIVALAKCVLFALAVFMLACTVSMVLP